MPGESHRKAAEQHERAAHAHRTAAAHQEQGEYLSAKELSRQALEHAAKAFQQSQEAYRLVSQNAGPKLEIKAPLATARKDLLSPIPGTVK